MNELPKPPALPPTLRARVLQDAKKAERAYPKSLALAAVVVGAALWFVLVSSLHGQRSNWSDLPMSMSWMLLVELALPAALSVAVALSGGAFMVGPSLRRILWALSAPLVGLALVLLFVRDTMPSPHDAFWESTLECDGTAIVVAFPIMVLLLLGQRGRVLASPRLVGAAAGVASAAWGHVMLHWGCPFTDIAHLVVGHVLPAIPMAFIGSVIAARLFDTAKR